MKSNQSILKSDPLEIGVPVRVVNALKKERHITTVGELIQLHECKLMRLNRVGETLVAQTIDALAVHGLELSPYKRNPPKKGKCKGKVVSITVEVDGKLITCKV